MKAAAFYSHKNGDALSNQYPHYFDEIVSVIEGVDAEKCRTKKSEEVTMPGKVLYSPKALNKRFKHGFQNLGWQTKRISLKTPEHEPSWEHTGFREVDFIKANIGVEVQFGKYAFLVYDIVAKMVIFNQQDIFDIGVEILPMKAMTEEMSSGIGHFQQVVADLYHRGEADIDIPVLIIGIEP